MSISTKAAALQSSAKLNEIITDFLNVTREDLYEIAELLDAEDYDGYITSTSIVNLYNDESLMQKMADKAGYPLYNPDGSVYVSPQDGVASRYLYIYIIYIYKFGSGEPFWANHIFDFLPRYDNSIISENEKLKLLFTAIGYEFDKIEEMISKITDLGDIDKVPDQYLVYLAQLLGYEKEDFQLGDTAFREIVKNIIEIYKIKGTNYSFEFFFKFLGFDYQVTEMFFDRDRDNPGQADNKASNYLTSTDPRARFETDPNSDEILFSPISPALYTETKNLEMFDLLASAAGRDIDVDILLGKTPGFPDPYAYFKTNFIQHELSQFYRGDTELMPQDPDIVDRIINKYIKFLSPSYIQSSINISLTPYVDGPVPIYEEFSIGLIKQIYDIIGVNAFGTDWEQLKATYNTNDTEEDVQTIEVTDDQLLRDIHITTEGAPLNLETDQIGDYIRYNGIHCLGRESPAHIIGLKYTLTFKTAMESVVAHIDHQGWDFTLTGDEFIEWLKSNPYPAV